MWRYVTAAVAAGLLTAAGWMFLHGETRSDAAIAPRGTLSMVAQQEAHVGDPLRTALPEAPERSREQKRFDRYDKDRDAKITRDEYMASRRKAFAKLDVDGDGRLSFDEWSAKTSKRFSDADTDRSGVLDAAEFATTKPKPKRRARPTCACAAATPRDDD